MLKICHFMEVLWFSNGKQKGHIKLKGTHQIRSENWKEPKVNFWITNMNGTRVYREFIMFGSTIPDMTSIAIFKWGGGAEDLDNLELKRSCFWILCILAFDFVFRGIVYLFLSIYHFISFSTFVTACLFFSLPACLRLSFFFILICPCQFTRYFSQMVKRGGAWG